MTTDATMKLSRVRAYLTERGYTGMSLIRQDNFSWISCGGSNRVVIPSEEGFAAVVITQMDVFLVAQVMDGQRIMDEEMGALEAEYVPLRWYECSVKEKARQLAGERAVGDAPGLGDVKLDEIYELHFPYTDAEMALFGEAGAMADEVLARVAAEIRPGMPDCEAEAMLMYEFTRRGAMVDVCLVGTDERVFRYRHPNPVGARLRDYVLLTPAVRFKGLHCNIARSVYFGDKLPERIERAHRAVSEIAARIAQMCQTGRSYAEILAAHQKMLAQFGFGDAWRGHYPGGRTGYFVCQAGLSQDPARVIGEREAFEWFITVPGVKVAELTLKGGDEIRIASNTGRWPSTAFGEFSIPGVLLR